LEKLKPEDQRAPWIGSWSTPLVATIDGKEQVVVSLPHHVQGYDLETGAILWRCEGLGDLVYTDPLIGEGVGVVMSGFHGPAIGFRLGGAGDVTERNRLWQTTTPNPQRIGSGVIVGGYVYMANESGVVQCLDPTTGREVWKDRFSTEKNWGSLVAAEGRLYVTNKAGDTIVFAPNLERYEPLAVNSLGEPSNSTPAVSDGQIFLRTFEAVYCIEEGE
jgi:outer membrane protein assembly factor BamB